MDAIGGAEWVAGALRDRRLRLGLTQAQVAQIATDELGMDFDQAMLANVEAAERSVGVVEVMALCVALGCTLDELLFPAAGRGTPELMAALQTSRQDEDGPMTRMQRRLFVEAAMRRAVAEAGVDIPDLAPDPFPPYVSLGQKVMSRYALGEVLHDGLTNVEGTAADWGAIEPESDPGVINPGEIQRSIATSIGDPELTQLVTEGWDRQVVLDALPRIASRLTPAEAPPEGWSVTVLQAQMVADRVAELGRQPEERGARTIASAMRRKIRKSLREITHDEAE